MINRFNTDQQGQTQTEYALALVLVAIVAIGALALLGTAVSGVFGQTVNFFSGDEENPGHIIVSAVDANGQGIENVRIYAYYANGLYADRYGNTNARGELVFDNLDENSYRFRANYQQKTFWSDTVTWSDERQAIIDTGQRPLTVYVMDAAGNGISGVAVYAFTTDDQFVERYGDTGPEGSLTLDLSDGDYRFRADYRHNEYWSADMTSPTSLEAEINTGQRFFTVSVLDQAGKGLNDVPVLAFNTDDQYIGVSGNTDADGNVSLLLPDGNFRFRADYRLSHYWSEDANSPGTTTISIQTNQVPVTVSVYNLDGDGLKNVKVYAFTISGEYVGVHATTDRKGEVTLDLPAGDFQFRADYRGDQYWSDGITTPTETTATIATGEQTFTVSVLDQAGAGIENVPVYAFNPSGRYIGISGSTDADGNVSLPLPNGAYKFRADYRGYEYWSRNVGVPGMLSVSIQTGEANSQISVYDSANQPLSNVEVYAFTATGQYVGVFGNTDENGELSVPLPTGQFQFRVDYSGSSYWSGIFNSPGNITVTVSES